MVGLTTDAGPCPTFPVPSGQSGELAACQCGIQHGGAGIPNCRIPGTGAARGRIQILLLLCWRYRMVLSRVSVAVCGFPDVTGRVAVRAGGAFGIRGTVTVQSAFSRVQQNRSVGTSKRGEAETVLQQLSGRHLSPHSGVQNFPMTARLITRPPAAAASTPTHYSSFNAGCRRPLHQRYSGAQQQTWPDPTYESLMRRGCRSVAGAAYLPRR